MNVKEFLNIQISQALAPQFLQIDDESYKHNVPEGAQSHFKVTVVSDNFEGLRLLSRHRKINELAAQALAGSVHALALHTYTPDEWAARGNTIVPSPNCLGGSKNKE